MPDGQLFMMYVIYNQNYTYQYLILITEISTTWTTDINDAMILNKIEADIIISQLIYRAYNIKPVRHFLSRQGEGRTRKICPQPVFTHYITDCH